VKILLFSRYSHLGASSRLRMLQYLPYFRENGIEVKVHHLLDDRYLKTLYDKKKRVLNTIFLAYLGRLFQLLKSKQYDLLWIEKELFPMLPAWFEQLIRFLGIPYVVDYDDAVFHNYDLHPNKWVRKILGMKIDRVMKNSSLVVAGNDYLATRARRAGATQVEIFPTVIDINRYQLAQKESDFFFTVGWIGSLSTAEYLLDIRSALVEIGKRDKTMLCIVGAKDVEIQGITTQEKIWTEKTEVNDISSFDIGIMPLRNNSWDRGKCGYKLIQYMACGKPVVASPVGVNNQIVEHGVNGFLAETELEWIEALRTLRDNPELRAKMGAAARKKVIEKYTIQKISPELLSQMRQVKNKSHLR